MMTIILELSPELEAKAQHVAKNKGILVQEMILQELERITMTTEPLPYPSKPTLTSAPEDSTISVENNLPIEQISSQPNPPRKAGNAKAKILYMADDFNQTPDGFEEYLP